MVLDMKKRLVRLSNLKKKMVRKINGLGHSTAIENMAEKWLTYDSDHEKSYCSDYWEKKIECLNPQARMRTFSK